MTAAGRVRGRGEGLERGEGTADQADDAVREAEARAFQMSPLALAYVGDAVWELAVRQMLAVKGERRPNRLHRLAVPYVQASGQADRLARILEQLGARERSVFMRGRNAKSGSVPRSATIGEYRLSTGFEALLGYLHLAGNTDRLNELVSTLLDDKAVLGKDSRPEEGRPTEGAKGL